MMVVPQTNRTKRRKYDGNSLVYTSHFLSLPSVSPCHSVFSKNHHALALLSLKKKKKKHFGTKNCILVSLMTCKETGDVPPLVVRLEEYQWEPNIKDWRTEREKQNEREANVWHDRSFSTVLYLPKGTAFIINTYNAFDMSRLRG